MKIKEKDKTDNYAYIKNVNGLFALVQLGVLEIHLWNSTISHIEKPDMFIFDLDPGPDVEWKKVIKTAFRIKENLELINLKSFVKTTGGKGLHIVVPIKRRYTWSQIKDFTKHFTLAMVEQYPGEYVAEMTKSKRVGKIYIDYQRNQRGATAVAPYSTRATANAPVSVPLSWDELTTRIKSDTFNIHNLITRLIKLKKDPWEGFFALKQTIKI